MNCAHFKNSTFDFLDGNLSVKNQKAMNDHLAICNNCRTFLSEENQLKKSLKIIFEKETDSLVLSSNIIAKIKLSTKRKKQKTFDFEKLSSVAFSFFSPRFAMAAVTISVIIFSFLFVNNLNNKKQPLITKKVDCIQQSKLITLIETPKKSTTKEKSLNLQADQTLQEPEKPAQNVVAKKFVKINGIVRDSKFMTEIDDVEIVCVSPSNKFADARWSDFTDENGNFQMTVASEELNFEFRHPDYAPVRKHFSSADNKRTPTVELSKGGDVLVCVSPKEKNDCIVKLIGNFRDLWLYRTKLSEMFSEKPDDHGTVLFKNVPSHLPSVKVEIFDKKTGNKIAYTDTFFIKPEDTKVININLDSAKLIVRFSENIKNNNIRIKVCRNEKKYTKSFFIKRKKEYILQNLEEGFYDVTIEKTQTLCLQTNIYVNRFGKTILDVSSDVFNKMTGIIKGKFISNLEKLNLVNVNFYLSNYKNGYIDIGNNRTVEKLQYYVPIKNRKFCVRNLDLEKKYDIMIIISTITNILIKSVQPSQKELEIIIPDGYHVTGCVKDEAGKELKAWVFIDGGDPRPESKFDLYPIAPGKHFIKICVPGYFERIQKVTVISEDVDLGEIVLLDKDIEQLKKKINVGNDYISCTSDHAFGTKEGIFTMEGNVNINYKELTLKSKRATSVQNSQIYLMQEPAKLICEKSVHCTADESEYDEKTKTRKMTGNFKIKYKDIEITAPSAILNENNFEIIMEGPIKFSMDKKQSTKNGEYK